MQAIQKTYYVNKRPVDVLKGINLTIEKGEFVAIRGKSGCGKTTLLNIIGLMHQASGGMYFFNDKNMRELSKKEKAMFRNQHLGYVFQSFNLIEAMSVVQNIAMPLGYAGKSNKERTMRALEVLEMVGLKDKFANKPFQLSGGEQQRVALARAVVNQPELLVTDEPTGNLDEENGRQVMSMINALHQRGTTVVMVTHDDTIASYADRVIHIRDGLVV